jgi:hypothetical protein
MGYQDIHKNHLTNICEKSAYKIARDKWIEEIVKAFKEVEIACANL